MPSALWRQSDFLKLWTGQSISRIGSHITSAGLPLTAVFLLGASPLQMGFLNGTGAAAVLLFGLFAGAWADRVRRRPLLIAADLGRFVLLASVPVAAFAGHLRIGHLYIVIGAAAVLDVLFDVSYQAYVPFLVAPGYLLEANSKLALSSSISEVTGPGLTGALVQWLTAPIAIAFDAASFLVSAISLWWIRTPESPPARVAGPRILGEIADGLKMCWGQPLLRALMLRTSIGAFCIGFQGGLYILYAVRELRLNAALLGLVIAAGGASNLAGAFFSYRVVRRFGFGSTIIGAGVLLGVASLLPPLAHGSIAACCAILLVAQMGDAAWPLTNVCDLSLRQAVTPPGLLGRVNSAMHLMFHGVLPAGAMAGGALAGVIGIRATMFAGGLGFLLSTLFLVFSPIRKLRELPAAAAAR